MLSTNSANADISPGFNSLELTGINLKLTLFIAQPPAWRCCRNRSCSRSRSRSRSWQLWQRLKWQALKLCFTLEGRHGKDTLKLFSRNIRRLTPAPLAFMRPPLHNPGAIQSQIPALTCPKIQLAHQQRRAIRANHFIFKTGNTPIELLEFAVGIEQFFEANIGLLALGGLLQQALPLARQWRRQLR